MNRLIERELAAKSEAIANAVEGARVACIRILDATARSLPADPGASLRLMRLATLITEYNTLQALQAEIDS